MLIHATDAPLILYLPNRLGDEGSRSQETSVLLQKAEIRREPIGEGCYLESRRKEATTAQSVVLDSNSTRTSIQQRYEELLFEEAATAEAAACYTSVRNASAVLAVSRSAAP